MLFDLFSPTASRKAAERSARTKDRKSARWVQHITKLIKRIPILGPLVREAYRKIRPFEGSESYWINRYNSGGNSGAGSYNELANFKAGVLNSFVEEKKIETIIEHGCGDGNQLRLATYPSYVGLDVSQRAVLLCQEIFRGDRTKTFKDTRQYAGETAELALSLDVIYHLVEDDTFLPYMERLFNSSWRFVIIYSSNSDENNPNQARHVKHRAFTKWVEENRPHWQMIRHIPNQIPFSKNTDQGSFAEFFVFENVSDDCPGSGLSPTTKNQLGKKYSQEK